MCMYGWRDGGRDGWTQISQKKKKRLEMSICCEDEHLQNFLRATTGSKSQSDVI